MFRVSGIGKCWLFVLLGLLIASSAKTDELQIGATAQYVYNSNFFSSAANENEANSFQIGPNIGISDGDGRFRYDVFFAGSYQAFVDQGGADAWESQLRARATYDIDRRTTIRVTERFRDVSNLRFSRADITLAVNSLDPRQDRYFRNDVEAEVIRELTRNLTLSVRAGHLWTDFKDNIDRNDSQGYNVGSELNYRVATAHTLGVGVTYTYQDFDEAESRFGSTADYLNTYAIWTWQIADRIQFSMNGGPAWVRSDEDSTNVISQSQFVGARLDGDLLRADFASCFNALASNCDLVNGNPIPANDLGGRQNFALTTGERVGHESVLTFFGGASIQASFAEWNLLASYSRRQNSTTGAALASSFDQVLLNLEYAPPKYRWSTFVAASWDRRSTLTDATLIDFNVAAGTDNAAERTTAFTSVTGSGIGRDNYTAIVGVRNALTRQWSGTLEFRYRRTELDDPRTSRPGIDTYFVLFSVDFDYDPIQF